MPMDLSRQIIAVDVAGNDHGIAVGVEGAVRALRDHGVHSILVGPASEVNEIISGLGADSKDFQIVDAPESIGSDESPTWAIRRKPNSSILLAFNLLNQERHRGQEQHRGTEWKKASAVVSAGNSGATIAAGRVTCGLLPGIERPAIATLLPVAGDRDPSLLLDCGANVDCNAYHLVQFAIMGSVYWTSLFSNSQSRVALLSNGTEQAKGTDSLRTAYQLLRESALVDFIGYIEGRDVVSGKADVIVCDGFVGNVVLKTLEGCVRLVEEELSDTSSRGLRARLGHSLMQQTYREVFVEKFDYSAHGGAPVLGLNKLALVLHGASDVRAVINGIVAAARFADMNLCGEMAHALCKLEDKLSGRVNGSGKVTDYE